MVGLTSALAVACAPADEGAGSREAGDAGAETAGEHPRAGYLTSLTFVGFETSPSLVHLRFENEADHGRLALSYQGWVAGRSDWSPLFEAEDTIPVARAAWRVVPTPGMRLRVSRGAQVEAVRLPVDGTPLRLEALDVISSWSSSTGQRETLRSAELLLGPGAEAGLLLQRRRARSLEAERTATASQAFVVTDTLGDGLVILRNRISPDAPATAWGWIDGERIEWSDAVLLSLAPSEGSPGRWSLEIAREGIVVEVEGSAPVRETSSSMGSSYRLYPIRATLSVDDEVRTMAGIGIEDDGP
ncbi:MAG: hypothetical protein ACODAB_04400 [Gemmatimonadota bacterium]